MKPNPTAPNRTGLSRVTRWADRLGRRSAAGLTILAALGLSACGSGSRVDDFHPERIVVFGDELSLVANGSASSEPAGSKYTINTLPDPATGVVDCGSNPMWTQILGSQFGFSMPGCGGSAGNAAMLAAYGATVDTLVTQVSGYTGTMDSKTLVTLMGGLHDVLAAYRLYKAGGKTHDEALALVADAGRRLGNLVNSVARNGSGGRVVYATMPDLGLSPYAIAEGQQALLSELSAKFNEQLRLTVVNDGRYVGLVATDATLQAMVTAYKTLPSSNGYGLANVTEPACQLTTSQFDGSADGDMAGVYSSQFKPYVATSPVDPHAVIGCSTLTLVSGASGSATTYLWADDVHPSPNWQRQVGSAAVTRATNNPF